VKLGFPARMRRISIEEMEVWLGKRFVSRERGEIILYSSIAAYATIFSILTISNILSSGRMHGIWEFLHNPFGLPLTQRAFSITLARFS
jgi:hypothetical protein